MQEQDGTQVITIKAKIVFDEPETAIPQIRETMARFTDGCNFVSDYLFGNGFPMNQNALQKALYADLRLRFGLKSQMAQSAIKAAVARYKTEKTKLENDPFVYADEDGKRQTIRKTLEWLWKPVHFHRPQVDLVRGRDWSRLADGKISVNTLSGRVKATPVCKGFDQYFDGSWKFGGAKIVEINGMWFLHISATKFVGEYDVSNAKNVVGVDRGLRFLAVTYDSKGKTKFFDGKRIMEKRENFAKVRAELQCRGTKSAKRRLREISGRENRWMTDVNHQLSKTLVQMYGPDTVFAIEDLTSVSFSKENLRRPKKGKRDLRSWAFYQLEQFLGYKAALNGSCVVKVSAAYTSQRCPKCGSIRKDNRKHETHEYSCSCGFRSNDDRSAAMNIHLLGTLFVSGMENPHFEKHVPNANTPAG